MLSLPIHSCFLKHPSKKTAQEQNFFIWVFLLPASSLTVIHTCCFWHGGWNCRNLLVMTFAAFLQLLFDISPNTMQYTPKLFSVLSKEVSGDIQTLITMRFINSSICFSPFFDAFWIEQVIVIF